MTFMSNLYRLCLFEVTVDPLPISALNQYNSEAIASHKQRIISLLITTNTSFTCIIVMLKCACSTSERTLSILMACHWFSGLAC